MKLSENYTDACINTGFFPGCIPEIFVFGNDLKVDVRTGNLITGDGFNTDQEVRADKLARYEQLKNNPVMLAALEDSPEYARIMGNAALSAEERNNEIRELELDLGIRVEASTSTIGNFFNKLGNFFTGNGFNTDANLALKDIASGNTDNKIVEFENGNIIKTDGNGIMMTTDGRVIQLKGTEDFNRLLTGATENGGYSSFGNIDNVGSVDELLNTNVKDYYKGFKGGNSNAVNERGGTSFNYDMTAQSFATSDSPRTDANGVPYEYYSYVRGKTTSNPDSYIEQGDRAEDWFNNDLNCIYASKIDQLKSSGLLNPELNIYDANSALIDHDRSQGRSSFTDNGIVDLAKKTDWAQLTGSADKNFEWERFSSVNTDAAKSFLNNGGIIMTDSFDNGTHIRNVVNYNYDMFKTNNPIGGTIDAYRYPTIPGRNTALRNRYNLY